MKYAFTKYFKLIDNEKFLLEGGFWTWSPFNHLALRRAINVFYGELCDYEFQLHINIAFLIVSFSITFIIFRKDEENDK